MEQPAPANRSISVLWVIAKVPDCEILIQTKTNEYFSQHSWFSPQIRF